MSATVDLQIICLYPIAVGLLRVRVVDKVELRLTRRLLRSAGSERSSQALQLLTRTPSCTMKYPTPLTILVFLFLNTPSVLSSGYGRSQQQKPPGRDAILLSRVQSLTLRPNRLTTSRRLAPIPQLTCTGPSKSVCDMYTLETMRCINAGFDYDEEDIQWTCTAPLPPEFKLGSTDVVCEGYRNADDKWVLKGSCGVEYRLLLTELGEERFGRRMSQEDQWSWRDWKDSNRGWRRVLSLLGNLVFFGFIMAVFVMIMWPMLRDCFGLRGNRPNLGRGGGGFWGGGPGGGDDDGYPGPPPPYSRYSDSSSFSSTPGWRPGFWSGALGGAAAGYQFGRRNQRYDSPFAGGRPTTSTRFQDFHDPGEGSSRVRSPPRFSTTTTGTGFGSTRRR